MFGRSSFRPGAARLALAPVRSLTLPTSARVRTTRSASCRKLPDLDHDFTDGPQQTFMPL
jgi:hypothetical protein